MLWVHGNNWKWLIWAYKSCGQACDQKAAQLNSPWARKVKKQGLPPRCLWAAWTPNHSSGVAPWPTHQIVVVLSSFRVWVCVTVWVWPEYCRKRGSFLPVNRPWKNNRWIFLVLDSKLAQRYFKKCIKLWILKFELCLKWNSKNRIRSRHIFPKLWKYTLTIQDS